jgi:NAD(P)-dependent dehydrogenase (short-subunit alcohol dehydrogenase family)
MRVFVTGGTGHSGSYIIPELIAAGHEVTGLARSDTAAAALSALGAKVRRGDLQDLDGLKEAAADSDGVIHVAHRPERGTAKADRVWHSVFDRGFAFPSMRSTREHGVLDGVHGAEDDGADLLYGRMPLFVAPAARQSSAGIAEPLRPPSGVSFEWAGCAGSPTSPRR